MSSPLTDLDNLDAMPPARAKRPWRLRVSDAFRGMKLGIRNHSTFFVHFFFAALVLASAFLLGCEVSDWCILILCIGMVLTAELFNSALETLFRGLDDETKGRGRKALDVAAGAVLLASIFAAIVGIIVFVHRIVEFTSISNK